MLNPFKARNVIPLYWFVNRRSQFMDSDNSPQLILESVIQELTLNSGRFEHCSKWPQHEIIQSLFHMKHPFNGSKYVSIFC